MVPADSDDIAADYEVLLNELARFNPQLMDKPRILAISKSDMLDEELTEAIRETLPEGIPYVFISAVTGQGITELKDVLWTAITAESNKIVVNPITHRPLDGHHRVREEDEFIFEQTPIEDDDFEEYYDDEEGDYDEYDWDEEEEEGDV